MSPCPASAVRPARARSPARPGGSPPIARYPEDREDLLREAADAWSAAGEYDRALALYERLLDPDDGGCAQPDLVDAFRINALWDAGGEEEARAAALAFRGPHPRDASAWNFVGEAFESHDEEAAAEWYTADITHVLGAGIQVTADAVEASPDHFDPEMLVIARHRARRLTGAVHDDWDDVADELHARRRSGLPGEGRPLDEAHDPIRLRRMRDGGSELAKAVSPPICPLPVPLCGRTGPQGRGDRLAATPQWNVLVRLAAEVQEVLRESHVRVNAGVE